MIMRDDVQNNKYEYNLKYKNLSEVKNRYIKTLTMQEKQKRK